MEWYLEQLITIQKKQVIAIAYILVPYFNDRRENLILLSNVREYGQGSNHK